MNNFKKKVDTKKMWHNYNKKKIHIFYFVYLILVRINSSPGIGFDQYGEAPVWLDKLSYNIL